MLAENAPPALAMPAAGLSAESGAPILLVASTGVPTATRAELRSLHRPTIYVVGPSAVNSRVLAQLAHLGAVKPIGGGSGEESDGRAGTRSKTRSPSRASPTARSAGASTNPATVSCS